MLTKNPIVEKGDWANNVYFPPTIKYNETVLPKVLEAQQFDLKKVLGKKFYAQIVLCIDNLNELPAGFTEFTQDDYDNILSDMKEIVMNFAYARYLEVSDYHNTRMGTARKIGPHSEKLDTKEKDRLIQHYRNLAANYVGDLCEYLEDNASTYPTWSANRSDKAEIKQSGGINFSAV